jgi:Tfp pilus assembly protein PilN
MPGRTLNEAIDRQEHLLAEIKKLRRVVRLQFIVVAIVLLIGVVSGFAAVTARSAAAKAERVNNAFLLEACHSRNAGNRETRKGLSAQVDAWEHALSALVTTEAGRASSVELVKELREAIPTADKQDRDCTVPPNGLGPDDYPT